MNKIKLIFLSTLFYSIALPSYAEELQYIDDGAISYFCDNKKSNFYLSVEQNKLPLKDYKKQTIDIDSLLISEEDSDGKITRLGSKKSINQCGGVKLTFESGYYNSNTQGFLGLMDYPLISLSIEGKKIVDKKPLNLCTSGGLRMICPTDYSIQNIKIVKDMHNSYQITLTKALPINNSDSFKFLDSQMKCNKD